MAAWRLEASNKQIARSCESELSTKAMHPGNGLGKNKRRKRSTMEDHRSSFV